MTFNSVIFALALAMSAIGQGTRAAEVHLAPHTFTLPDGFEIEMVAGPPLVMRPMMADFDDQGRLYVADSSGSNRQGGETTGGKAAPDFAAGGYGRGSGITIKASCLREDKLMFPEGVLWHDGAIYTGAPPSIWKLEDTDGDGVADRRTEWHLGLTLTGCANDLHGPYTDRMAGSIGARAALRSRPTNVPAKGRFQTARRTCSGPCRITPNSMR